MKQGLKRLGSVAGLAAMIAPLGGCGDEYWIDQDEFNATLGPMFHAAGNVQEDSRKAQGWHDLGDLADASYQHNQQLRVAREGRDNVNININPGQNNVNAMARFDSINPVFDTFVNGEKGITVNLKYTVQNSVGRVFAPMVFFYWDNGKIMEDLDNNYVSADGQVATTGNPLSANYQITEFNYPMFIPYSQLDGAQAVGKHDMRFKAEVFEIVNGQWISKIQSGDTGFYITNK